MSNSDHRIYVHFVWTTKHRQPTLSTEIERAVHRIIESEAHKLECAILAVNGTEDHIHVLVQLGPQVPAARLMNQFKGVTSRFINEHTSPEIEKFTGWQRGYGVGINQITIIVNYIARQKERHDRNAIWPFLEPPPEHNSSNPAA